MSPSHPVYYYHFDHVGGGFSVADFLSSGPISALGRLAAAAAARSAAWGLWQPVPPSSRMGSCHGDELHYIFRFQDFLIKIFRMDCEMIFT